MRVMRRIYQNLLHQRKRVLRKTHQCLIHQEKKVLRKINPSLLHQGKRVLRKTHKILLHQVMTVLKKIYQSLLHQGKRVLRKIHQSLLLQKVVLRTRLKELVKQIVTPTTQIWMQKKVHVMKQGVLGENMLECVIVWEKVILNIQMKNQMETVAMRRRINYLCLVGKLTMKF